MKTSIKGLDQLRVVSKKLRAIPEAMDRAAYRSVNSVTSKVVTQARRDIAARVNLPQSYIREQTRVTPASAVSPIAYVRMRIRGVALARFAARQIMQAAPKARGDASRKIPRGRKQAGVSVQVSKAGGRKTLSRAFLLPLRAGNAAGGNGFGVFIRDGSRGPKSNFAGLEGMDMGKYQWRGNIRHLYGPSPHQIFRGWKESAAPEIKNALLTAYAAQLRYELRGSRK